MLPAKYRLCLRKELSRVRKEGRLVSGRLFGLLIAKQNPEGLNSRFSFIVSKKIHKNSVWRNRIRRLLAESIQSIIGEVRPGFDCVFLVKKAIVGQNLAAVKKEVERVFNNEEICFTPN